MKYETNAEGIPPDDTRQLMYRWDEDVVLKDFVLDHGLQLVRVIAGKVRVTADSEGKASWGQAIKAKTFVVAIAKNVTDAPIIGKGTWFVEGHNLKPQAQTAQVLAGFIPPKVTPELRTKAKTEAMAQTRAKGRARITEYPVGSNEVAVPMSFGECRRLLDSINGATPIQAFERPGFLRRFNHALAIFQGQEVPVEAPSQPGVPNEKDQEIVALKMRVQELSDLNREFEGAWKKAEEEVHELQDKQSSSLADKEVFQLGYLKAVDDLLDFVNEKQETLMGKAEEVLRMVRDIRDNGFKSPPLIHSPTPPAGE